MHAHPTIYFLGFSTWGFHNHFVRVKYMTRGPIGRNVYFGSLQCFSFYNNIPPYLCFPFIGRRYTYNKSHIRCGFCFFTIVVGVFNLKAFSATNKMCSLVSIGVGPLYIISSWLYYSRFGFSYFGHIGGI
jgi:hypothetical protein